MRIPSGVTDQVIYFVAVDSTDLKARETGLSSFTVYRSRDGATAVQMTSPTISETDATNMPGVYDLLLNEDMTIGSGNDSEEMCFHITQASMAPVTRTIELYRSKITAGNTLGVASDGDVSGNVDGTVDGLNDLSAADVNAEVLDVMNIDTFTEIGQEAPAATNTIFYMIRLLFKMLLNKSTADNTSIKLFNDAGSVVDQKRTVSLSGGLYTEEKIVSGP